MANEITTLQQMKDGIATGQNRAILRVALGLPDEEVNRILADLFTVLATMSDKARDELYRCTPISFIDCIKTAHQLGIKIDKQEHCYLVRYGNQCTLQVGYKGYIFAVSNKNPSFNAQIGFVFAGDEFSMYKNSDGDGYDHKVANPFNKKIDDLQGGYAHITYTGKDGRYHSEVSTLSKDEIDSLKKLSKNGVFWANHYLAMAGAKVIRKALKITFSAEIGKLDAYDNQFSIDLNKPINRDLNLTDVKGMSLNDRPVDMIDDKGERIDESGAALPAPETPEQGEDDGDRA